MKRRSRAQRRARSGGERVARDEEQSSRLRQEPTTTARAPTRADAAALAVRDEPNGRSRTARSGDDIPVNRAGEDERLYCATAEKNQQYPPVGCAGCAGASGGRITMVRTASCAISRDDASRCACRSSRASARDDARGARSSPYSLDEAELELNLALPNARNAADATARRLEAEPELTIVQLEEEIALARVANLPLLAPEGDDERTDDDDPLTEEVPALDVALGPRSEAEPVAEPAPKPASREKVEEPAAIPAEAAAEAALPEAVPAETTVDDESTDPEDESAVDALFARIREARSDAVARAYEVFGPADSTETAAAVVVAEPVAAEEDAAEPDVFAQRDAVINPFEAKLARLFKRAVNDEQNEVQDAIRRRKRRRRSKSHRDSDTPSPYDRGGSTIGDLAREGGACSS